MRKRLQAAVLFGGLVATVMWPWPASGAELKPETIAAWDRYVKRTEERIHGELGDGRRFLALDFHADAREVRRALLEGQVVIRSAASLQKDGAGLDIPLGRVHHWRAAVLVRGIRLGQLIPALRDPHLHGYNPPDVLKWRLLERQDQRERVYLQIQRREIVTVVFNTEHDVEFTTHTPTRISSRSVSTRITEVEHAGTAQARERPVGDDRGFLWRLNSYWRYEEVAGGVLVELESLTLSRDVPMLLAPIAQPIVARVARESMTRTLTGIRDQLGRPGAAASH